MFQDCSKIYMGIALKHAWNIAGKYALEPHGTVPRFLGTLGTVLSPGTRYTAQGKISEIVVIFFFKFISFVLLSIYNGILRFLLD